MSTVYEWSNLRDNGGVWMHSGDPRSPHVVLRSGLHSNGFIDTLQYLSVTSHLARAAGAQARAIEKVLGDSRSDSRIDWVIGSPMAGIPFATMVGTLLASGRVGFTEKRGDTDLVCRFDMEPGSRVLFVEEMSTTGGTPQRGINAVLAKNPGVEIIPYVGAFLTRGGKKPPELTSAEFISLIDLTEIRTGIETWKPDECPLCGMGSRVITNPKKVWWLMLANMGNPDLEIPGAEYQSFFTA